MNRIKLISSSGETTIGVNDEDFRGLVNYGIVRANPRVNSYYEIFVLPADLPLPKELPGDKHKGESQEEIDQKQRYIAHCNWSDGRRQVTMSFADFKEYEAHQGKWQAAEVRFD